AVVDVAVGWVVAVAVTVGVLTAISMVMAVTLAVDMAKEAKNLFTNILILLILSSIGLGISVATGIIIGFNTFILLALNGTSLPALFMLVYPPLK
ncbi:MAG: serine/threonine protein kinase, partial [Dolichospermum sp.]